MGKTSNCRGALKSRPALRLAIAITLLAAITVAGGVAIRLQVGPSGQRRVFHPRSLRFEDFELYAFPFTRFVFHARHLRDGEHPVRRAAMLARVSLDESSPQTSVVYESINAQENWTPQSWGYQATVCGKYGNVQTVDLLMRRMDNAETSPAAAPFVKRFAEALQAEDYLSALEIITEARSALRLERP